MPPTSGDKSSLSSSFREKFYPEMTPFAKDSPKTGSPNVGSDAVVAVETKIDDFKYPNDDDGEYEEIQREEKEVPHYMMDS